MILLVVDNNLERLWNLVCDLRQLSPENTVEYTHDPLMAGRFIANKHVDVIMCDYNMRPISGAQLKCMVHHFQPSTKAVIITDSKTTLPEFDAEDAEMSGMLKRPITDEALRSIVSQFK